MRMKLSWRGGRSKGKESCLDGGRRTTQLMRDSLGGPFRDWLKSTLRHRISEIMAVRRSALRFATVGSWLLFAGCVHPAWYSQTVAPEVLQRDQDQETLRLTLRDSSVLVAHYPKLIADTLVWVGRPDGAPFSPGDSAVRFAIPIDQIASVARLDQPAMRQRGPAATLAFFSLDLLMLAAMFSLFNGLR